MKREFLANLKIGDTALTKEIIDAIMEENGKDIESAKGDAALLQSQLDETKAALAKFDGVSVEELQSKITQLQNDLTTAETNYKNQIEERDFNDLLNASIAEAKGRNAKAVKALLDIDALRKSKNQKDDIKSALEAVKQENDYLFTTEKTAPPYSSGTGVHSSNGHENDDIIAKFRAAAGLSK